MKTSTRKILLASALLVGACLPFAYSGTPTKVVTPVEPPQESPWRFSFAPYGWLAATEGDLTIANITAPVDVDWGDALDELDMAAMGVIEVGYEEWFVNLDAIYGKMSDGTDLPGRFGFKSVEMEQEQIVLTPKLGYRLIDSDGNYLDLFGGARWTKMSVDFTLRRSNGDQATRGVDHDWWDPVVGLRGRAMLGDRVFLQGTGLVGGFGVSSDFLWDAFAGIGYQFTPHIASVLGYRAQGVDYEDGGFAVDTVSHGFITGLEISW